MHKYKMFLKNMSIITIGQFGSKILVFLLVPLYTNVLTTGEYGLYDLITTTLSLLLPILTLNIYSSTQRFAMDEEADLSSIIKYSMWIVVAGTIALVTVLGFNKLFCINNVLTQYHIQIIFMFVLEACINVLTSFAMGISKVIYVAISGLLSTLVIVGSNLLFLLVFKWGLNGFFLANILGLASQALFLFISLRIWRYLDSGLNNVLYRKMLAFSIPLIANNIAWWINNASDRYIVTYFCGVDVNGIYSVAYKVPSILNLVQTAFSQAWSISAVANFDSQDKDGFFSKMYSIYNFAMVSVCSLLIIATKPIASILYAKDFFVAWVYVPFLLISVVFGALSGYLGGIFSAKKESKMYAQSTVIGAVCNVVLNIVLGYHIGALGAAIATFVSYVVVWIIRLYTVKKHIFLKVRLKRDIGVYFLLLGQTFVLVILDDSIYLYGTELLLFIGIVVLNADIVRIIISRLYSLIKGNKWKNQ